VALLLGVGALLVGARAWWAPGVSPGLVVEVMGEVARPGVHVVDPPTLAAAVEAAGGDSTGVPETPLRVGDAVVVAPDGVRVAPAGDPRLVGLPVDVNAAPADVLGSVPGLGRAAAEAIVAARKANGPFHALDEVARLPGVDASSFAGVAPMLTVGDAGPRPPIDLNTADAVALDSLPGIGPSLAAAIVDDRARRGPFPSVEALDRVPGIGPALVERVRSRVVAP
jgi:competence protein ComEA